MVNDTQIRPMLAAKFEEARTLKHLESDEYLLAQPKIDGMRVLGHNGIPRSRSWKEWTNTSMRQFFGDYAEFTHGLDGEMLPGIDDNPDRFREAMSGLRSADGSREFTYYIFDHFLRTVPYETVLEDLRGTFGDGLRVIRANHEHPYEVKLILCPTVKVFSLDDIYKEEEKQLAAGFEGLILRRRDSSYKWNRATAAQGWLTKLKRFEDSEAKITGVYPRYQNDNEATINELGLTSRSSHQDNLIQQEMVGGFDCVLADGTEFKIGVFNGWSLEDRARMWAKKDEFLGKYVTFKHQGYGGGYDKPRTPVLISFRDPVEL